jgi:hypothetical protein
VPSVGSILVQEEAFGGKVWDLSVRAARTVGLAWVSMARKGST